MGRDMVKKNAYDDKWKADNTSRYNMRFTKSSGIPDGLSKAAKSLGIAETAYIREAITEKLQRDGYLSQP